MADKNKPWYKKWWAILIFVFVGLMIIGSFLPDTDTSTQQTNNANQEQEKTPDTNTKSVSIGDEGRLSNTITTNPNVAPVCTTKEYFDEMVDTVASNDKIGFDEILRSSKCYLASTLDDLEGDYYGRVLVLDKNWGATKFRFVHPDALHYGETAWTYQENIIPIE